jgi:anthranilate phosphoribosyltransferase
MIKETIGILVAGKDLNFEEAAAVMEEIMTGQASAAQIGAFLTALHIKGETIDEIAGLAGVMREKATPLNITHPAIDIVGTGGDGSGSFNFSTAAAFVAAGAGIKVAKHGNRAATSSCGSADILEALGVNIDPGPETVADCVEKVGIGFMFAPAFHPAMKHVAPTRRDIGIRTVFNILGPLTNPARVEHIVLGVPSEELGHKIAAVLFRLGTGHSLVVYGQDGLDEISACSRSLIWEVSRDMLSPPYEVSPADFGFHQIDRLEIIGGKPAENASSLRSILDGKKSALRNAVVMNAAMAFIAGDITTDLKHAVKIAQDSIDSGRAREKLEKLITMSQRK